MNELAARRHRSCSGRFLGTCGAGCGPATHMDSEGIFLCCECWEAEPLLTTIEYEALERKRDGEI